MLTREQQLAIRLKQADKVIVGLLKIARLAMPDPFWQADDLINAARKHMGKRFPKEDE